MPSLVDPGQIADVYRRFRGDEPAAIEAVRGWVAAVVRRGRWRFRDPESVVQESLIKLVIAAREDRVRDPSSFFKLARTVAKCTCVDAYHRDRRRSSFEQDEPEVEAVEPDPGTGPAEAVAEREKYEIVLAIYQQLHESCRRLWELVYHDRLTLKEAAERLGINSGTARVRMHRCLQSARDLYRSAYG